MLRTTRPSWILTIVMTLLFLALLSAASHSASAQPSDTLMARHSEPHTQDHLTKPNSNFLRRWFAFPGSSGSGPLDDARRARVRRHGPRRRTSVHP
ncbi:hypothetical protein C8F01DRAFT_1141161 [Mycena amicta]|nr:hypothetical protein C8F01DRAFT_1141161 [Mycena amicta]